MSDFKEYSDREILILIAERQEQHAKNLERLNWFAYVSGFVAVFEAGAHLKNMSFVVSLLGLFK